VSAADVTEYVDLCALVAAEALFAEAVEQRHYDRLDRLWYVEMTDADRDEAQRQVAAQARAWDEERVPLGGRE